MIATSAAFCIRFTVVSRDASLLDGVRRELLGPVSI
jgi:hypothetical protein